MQRFSLRLIVILLFFWIALPDSSAQRIKVRNLPSYDLAPYHFGFVLGVNQMLFTVKTTPGFQDVGYPEALLGELAYDSAQLLGIEQSPAFGFTIGIVSNLRLNERFDLRFVPSLSFGERNLDYSIRAITINLEPDIPDIIITRDIYVPRKVQSTMIEFPLSLKYKGSRLNNMRPYWLIGVKYTIDLASDVKKSIEYDNTGNVISYPMPIKRHDIYGELGAGLDFYTTYFKFGVELKMAYGLTDILKHDDVIYTGAIDRMNSKLFLLSFTFE